MKARELLHPTSVRLPPELKSWLEEDAARKRRALAPHMVYIMEGYRESIEAHLKKSRKRKAPASKVRQDSP